MKLMALHRIFVAIIICFIAACSGGGTESRETFGEKTEWAVLQGVEFEHRDPIITDPVFLFFEEYEVMGVRGANDENVWVMLKPSSPPYYKQMPASGNFTVSKTLVESLRRESRLSYTVEHVLLSHVPAE